MTDKQLFILLGLVVGLVSGILITDFKNICHKVLSPSKAEIERQRNAELNKAYMRGYELGKAEGERDAILKKYTLNDLRAALGLSSIEGGAEWVKKNNS